MEKGEHLIERLQRGKVVEGMVCDIKGDTHKVLIKGLGTRRVSYGKGE